MNGKIAVYLFGSCIDRTSVTERRNSTRSLLVLVSALGAVVLAVLAVRSRKRLVGKFESVAGQVRGLVEQVSWIKDSRVTPGKEDDAEPEMAPEQALGKALLNGALESEQSLAALEKAYILQVLEHTEGNRTRTAEILGIGRRTLYRKLKEYGV